jgi:hypothetical protein
MLSAFPTHIAVYDCWYVYQTCATRGGVAAVHLNQHAHLVYERDVDGTPLCPIGLRMHPTYQFQHTYGYRSHSYRCPLLYPKPTGHSCDHEQFRKDKGCVKDINQEADGLMRVMLNRDSPLYKAVYRFMQAFPRVSLQQRLLCGKIKAFWPVFASSRCWPFPRISAQRCPHCDSRKAQQIVVHSLVPPSYRSRNLAIFSSHARCRASSNSFVGTSTRRLNESTRSPRWL